MNRINHLILLAWFIEVFVMGHHFYFKKADQSYVLTPSRAEATLFDYYPLEEWKLLPKGPGITIMFVQVKS